MKRFVIALTALSLIAPATAFAQSRHHDRNDRHIERHYDHRGRHVEKRVVIKKRVVRHRHWARGHRLPHEYRGRVVDYHRYHLRRPGRGQHWVRVDNDYLLVGIASGIIASVVAAQ